MRAGRSKPASGPGTPSQAGRGARAAAPVERDIDILAKALRSAVRNRDEETILRHWADIFYANFAPDDRHGFVSFFEACRLSTEDVEDVLGLIEEKVGCYFQPFYAAYRARERVAGHAGPAGDAGAAADLQNQAQTLASFCLVQCVISQALADLVTDELARIRKYADALTAQGVDWRTEPPRMEGLGTEQVERMKRLLTELEGVLDSSTAAELASSSAAFVGKRLLDIRDQETKTRYQSLLSADPERSADAIRRELRRANDQVSKAWSELEGEYRRVTDATSKRSETFFRRAEEASRSFRAYRGEIAKREAECRKAETETMYFKSLQVNRLAMRVIDAVVQLPVPRKLGEEGSQSGEPDHRAQLRDAVSKIKSAYNDGAVEQVTIDPVHGLIVACATKDANGIRAAARAYREAKMSEPRLRTAGPKVGSRFLRLVSSEAAASPARRYDAFGLTALHYFLLRAGLGEGPLKVAGSPGDLFKEIYAGCLEDDVLLPTMHRSISPILIARKLGFAAFMSPDIVCWNQGMCDTEGNIAASPDDINFLIHDAAPAPEGGSGN